MLYWRKSSGRVERGAEGPPEDAGQIGAKSHSSAARPASRWVRSLTDAATGEATLVADLAPTPVPTRKGRVPLAHDSSPKDLVVYDDRLFFSADDGAHGRELWAYDAATGEATLAANINPDHAVPYVAHSEPSGLTVFDDRLFFAASDGERGWELWAYDAATGEAVLAADVNAGGLRSSEGNSFPSDLTVYDGRLFFAAVGDHEEPGAFDRELWAYDATGEATLVTDIRPGPFGSAPSHLRVYDGRLFFRADDGEHGYELWYLSSASVPE
jgi:ELWxxDGT repeat protein